MRRRESKVRERVEYPRINRKPHGVDHARVGRDLDIGADRLDQPVADDDGSLFDRRTRNRHDLRVRQGIDVGPGLSRHKYV